MSESETNRRLMEELTDRFMNDPAFREQMRQDPEGTADVFAQSYDVQLAEEHRQGLRAINWDLPDEQLTERASKAAMCAWSQYK